jgi:hypothetical protein
VHLSDPGGLVAVLLQLFRENGLVDVELPFVQFVAVQVTVLARQ